MSRLPRFLIIKTGQAVPEARARGDDFEDWFFAGLGIDRFEFETIRVDQGQSLPAFEGLAGALVTGSPAMVSHRLDWSRRTAGWLADAHAAGLPILGVCYGHQLLAHALGGRVGSNPNGRRMGRVETRDLAVDDPLVGRFSPGEAFHVSHQEVVLEAPRGARVIGRADHDPNHALHFGGQAWGVQFHPEFDEKIMRAYIEARAESLIAEGQDPAALAAQIDGDTRGPELLQRFGDLVLADGSEKVA